jgi:flagellar biosynthesis protein FlhF
MSTFRTFRAPDTRSALAMVKAALGSEAIIIGTREVDNGMFRSKEIEVTAALPEAPAMPKLPHVSAYTPPPPAARRRASDLVREPAAPLETAPQKAAPQAQRFETRDELTSLRSSLEEVRREMRRMTGQVRMERELKLPPPATDLLTHLIHRGVEDSLAAECVRQAVQQASNSSHTTLVAAVRNALAQRLTTAKAPWRDGQRKIIALVGPTGVGKTTTIAKIAARALMETNQKVVLITADTYRIGASEQLARYGEIMAVPTYVARDRQELSRAIEKSSRADLVLIDTAGRSINEAVAQQAEMLRSVPGIELYLTVSACTGAREMSAAAERYRTLSPERLIITKVDEAIGPGSLLSAAVRIAQPIVAVADGQRVPEDIHALSSPELIELILGNPTADAASGAR